MRIECLHGTKFLNPDEDLDHDLDNFAPCKWGICLLNGIYWQGKILVGTKSGEFIEINEKTATSKLLSCGHGEGELWGLTVHPTAERFITASDDGTVRMWDIVNKVSGGSEPTTYRSEKMIHD